ncbi:ATP-grasp enzyme, D-alanine-D-alanine ligase [Sphaerochaeta pleomorpha str. Grapes]|uniref:ATP-grasp enzyme, D-alanine-D-alanine ligase n=1 Tax=Sphaerochaeta pleomorpha (strain ATCC BAA-1885 / DSM 22778 / Grapes) TaxID=158190 RepID=G8QR94_SPHPG|nr:ATP-grasp enzyme, D-alanine-D-alanine ligase [Sphaerochaeta pleomorpha]AEV28747.1 ATP-grasp enzyme, D-alanine-D-alanine ligase [Sphaerochaeta pleomorpha str. Grapes]
MNVLVVHDKLFDHPTKDELDTLLEVEQVSFALSCLGHQVDQLEFSLDFKVMKEQLEAKLPAVIFNLVETLSGSSLLHLAPEFFETMHIPYTGCGPKGMFLSSDKLLAKQLMERSSIPTPLWVAVQDTGNISDLMGMPLIIKPVAEEASVGINDNSIQTFSSPKALLQVLATKEGGPFFAEQFIEGREFNISIWSVDGVPTVLPPAEMVFLDYPEGKPEIAGYEAKWEEDSFAYTHTKRTFDFPLSDESLLSRLKELSLQCWTLFGAKGYARVDFRVDSQGNPFVLEVNMNPCIASDSGFTAACERAGFPYNAMIEQIIQGCIYGY